MILAIICGIAVILCAISLVFPLSAFTRYNFASPKKLKRFLRLGSWLSVSRGRQMLYACLCGLMPSLIYLCVEIGMASLNGILELRWVFPDMLFQVFVFLAIFIILTLLFLRYTVPMHLRVYEAQKDAPMTADDNKSKK